MQLMHELTLKGPFKKRRVDVHIKIITRAMLFCKITFLLYTETQTLTVFYRAQYHLYKPSLFSSLGFRIS